MMKKAAVVSFLAGAVMALSATPAGAVIWQETYRDFDSKLSCDLTALAWEARYPYNEYVCFQLSNGRWTMKYYTR
ncbi:hypothetical protein ABZ614_41670 [Streptomyces sp. NPDC013178]|uniref:hypothetical protein n=1 Tax=Streptomyces sp. NPDC013178 TaxID=3155118 RepID=UPI0033D15403